MGNFGSMMIHLGRKFERKEYEYMYTLVGEYNCAYEHMADRTKI